MEEQTNYYAPSEGKTLAWGSEALESETQTSGAGDYFKPDVGQRLKIKVNTNKDPVEYFKTFKEGETPKRRFDIQIFTNRQKKEDGSVEWYDEKTWSVAPMYLNKINKYINKTQVFEVEKKDQGWDVVPLGLSPEDI